MKEKITGVLKNKKETKMSKSKYNFNINNPSHGALIVTIVYLILSIIKIISGKLLNSASVYADGLNNLTDIISSLTIYIGIYIAKKPIDNNHHFDHYKYETIASFVVSLIMIFIGFDVVKSGIVRFVNNDLLISDPKLIYITIVSTMILILTYLYISYLAKKSHSIGLRTTSKEMFNDIIISIGTLLGTILSQFNLSIFDVIISIFVGILTIYSGMTVLKDTIFVLSDGFNENDLKIYKEQIYEIPFVENIKKIRGRYSGSKIYLDVVIEVNGELSVYKSHQITENIESMMLNKYGISDIDIHVEPLMNTQ